MNPWLAPCARHKCGVLNYIVEYGAYIYILLLVVTHWTELDVADDERERKTGSCWCRFRFAEIWRASVHAPSKHYSSHERHVIRPYDSFQNRRVISTALDTDSELFRPHTRTDSRTNIKFFSFWLYCMWKMTKLLILIRSSSARSDLAVTGGTLVGSAPCLLS